MEEFQKNDAWCIQNQTFLKKQLSARKNCAQQNEINF